MDPEMRLIGTWRLRSLDNSNEEPRLDAAGAGKAKADGLIMYDASGSMSAQIISPGNPASAKTLEYHAYFGTYTVDPVAATVTHHRIANNNPDAPTDVVRQYRFVSNDVLVLFPQGHPSVHLTFQRIG